MQIESIRAVAERLERYFDWYARVDPDEMTPAAERIVRGFVQLAAGDGSKREATALLRASEGIVLGSAWEELRAALRLLAHA